MQLKTLFVALAASLSLVGALPTKEHVPSLPLAQEPTTNHAVVSLTAQKRGLWHGMKNLIHGLHWGGVGEEEEDMDCRDAKFFHYCQPFIEPGEMESLDSCRDYPSDEFC